MNTRYYKPFSEILENALNSIARVTGCQIGLVTNDYNWIEKSLKGDCEFCLQVQSTKEGKSICDNLNWRAQVVATNFKDNYIYKCRYGLIEIVVPIYLSNRYLGSLYCGNFFEKKPDEKGWEEIKNLIPPGTDTDKAREAYLKADYINTQKTYDLQVLLGMLAKSMADLIDMDNHKFSSYDKILEYIDKNFQRDITLDDLSELSGFNASYISQLFRKRTDLTLTEFVSRVRVKKAKDLLLHSDMTIGEIAFAVGFKDQNYFSRVFKHHEGCTPNEYRKRLSID